jgi:diguanylate cyclase (GGDEF)-like protein
MYNILLVEDSLTIQQALTKALEDLMTCHVYIAGSLAECRSVLQQHRDDIDIAILDLHLPDAKHNEIVDFMLFFHIPSFVYSSTYNNDLREEFYKKNIIDYLLKDSIHSIEYTASLVHRVLKNKNVNVLVVDDSKTMIKYVSTLLKRQLISVVSASSAKEGLEKLKLLGDDIHLVITDYEMPDMDGIEMVKRIRRTRRKDELPIIAMSGSDQKDISAKFLKIGANDFIHKPFSHDELNTRVNTTLDLREYVQNIKIQVNKDFLTGLYNRRFLFDTAQLMVKQASREQQPLAVAVIDVDHFKKINDTFGHEAGDKALQELSSIMVHTFRGSDVVARLGGEEFCIILHDALPNATRMVFEKLRIKVENTLIYYDMIAFDMTISVGVYQGLEEDFETMVAEADKLLYEAKNSGRNQVKTNITVPYEPDEE